VLFVVIYFAVFGAGTGYVLRLIRVGPQAHEGERIEHGGPGRERTPARPLSAAPLKETAQGGQFHGH
jgi:cytochrome d ubiquinol oxidase subunit I